jgi:hypothetical protein
MYVYFSLIVALVVFSWPAMAQTCGQRADFAERLEIEYGEVQILSGITSSGSLMELFASARKDNSWSLVFTLPGGRSCMMSVGKYLNLKQEPFSVDPKPGQTYF